MLSHRKTEHIQEVQNIICSKCEFETFLEKDMIHHERSCYLTCEHSEFMCLTNKAMDQHREENHIPLIVSFDCHLCEWKGFSYLALERHKINYHNISPRENDKSNDKDQDRPEEEYIETDRDVTSDVHAEKTQVPESNVICGECGTGFSSTGTFQDHMQPCQTIFTQNYNC